MLSSNNKFNWYNDQALKLLVHTKTTDELLMNYIDEWYNTVMITI